MLDVTNSPKDWSDFWENSTDSILMTKKPFEPTVEEDLNRPYDVTLTEGEIGVILCNLEGKEGKEIDNIFEKLEGAVDDYYMSLDGSDYTVDDVQQCIADGTDYRDCVDHLVDSMEKNQNPYSQIPSRY